jgi:hypothetical protein
MEQIIIDGVDLSELKIKYDKLAKEQAEMRQSIRQGSSKFIADNMKQALAHVEEMKEAEELEVAEAAAVKATTLLKTVKFVSDVSGVSYYMPYYNSQAEYNPDGETITDILEDGDYELLSDNYKNEALSELYSIAEDMQSDVAEWNTSYC